MRKVNTWNSEDRDMQIHPHGYTFMLNDDYEVINYSKNIKDLNSLNHEEIINKPLKNLIDQKSWENFHYSLEEQKSHIYNGFDVSFKKNPERKFDASIFDDGSNRYLELEPSTSNTQTLKNLNKWILNAGNILQSIDNLDDLYQTALKVLNKVIGYEKSLFLKYNEVYDAEIVAELSSGIQDSFLNYYLIDYDEKPKNAQSLLLKLIRYIPDTQNPVTSFQNDNDRDNGSPVDYIGWNPPEKLCNFLLQYGINSYISFNIIINEKLWGKISFFNETPSPLSLRERETAISIFQQICNMVGMKLLQQMQQREANFHTLHAKIASAMASHDNFADGLNLEAPSLLNMTNADGIAWRIEKNLVKYGNTPGEEKINELIAWIESSSEGDKNIFHTHCLPRLSPRFEDIKKNACGVFYLSISPQDKQYIIWFRKEKVITRLDAASHSVPKAFTPEAFEKKQKTGYSHTWNKGDIDNAVKLKNSIINYIIQSSERLRKQNELLETLILERTMSLEKEIKKRKKAEEKMASSLEELKRSNLELENFAYVASHDLQEPLRKIQAFSDRLKKVLTDELDERASDYFNRLTNAAERMQKLINDLLSYSRVTTHARPFTSVDMDLLLEGVLSDLNVKISEKNAEVRVDKIGVIDGDEYQLQRLFQNLVQNALKFHKKDTVPVIEIINKSEGDRCILVVKDNGIGFDESYAHKIFELFERLHGRGDYEGTGLGLAICKKIVDRHNGEITTKSKPGEGAEFTISLPFKQ